MIGFRLQLKRHSDGRLMLTIPVGYKLLLLLIGVLILVSLITTRPEAGGGIFVRENIIPLILCIVSFLGAAYHERWIFEEAGGRITHQNGLIALHSNRVYRIADFEGIRISQFFKGKDGATQPIRRSIAFRPIVTLSLQAKEGKSMRLENYRISQRRRVEATARAIAGHCGFTYKNELTGSEDL